MCPNKTRKQIELPALVKVVNLMKFHHDHRRRSLDLIYCLFYDTPNYFAMIIRPISNQFSSRPLFVFTEIRFYFTYFCHSVSFVFFQFDGDISTFYVTPTFRVFATLLELLAGEAELLILTSTPENDRKGRN